jgi:hypothetical protein
MDIIPASLLSVGVCADGGRLVGVFSDSWVAEGVEEVPFPTEQLVKKMNRTVKIICLGTISYSPGKLIERGGAMTS